MRIAAMGTHGVGKTTLVEDFCAAHPGYAHVPEPYWLLAQAGVVFADGPNVADLEEQLQQSCALILATSEADVVFDYCPLDLIAYLEVVSAGEGFEWSPDGKLLGRIEAALARLDLLVFVPLRRPDEITVPIEFPKLRARVDARLKTMLREDDLGLLADGPRVIEVTGRRGSGWRRWRGRWRRGRLGKRGGFGEGLDTELSTGLSSYGRMRLAGKIWHWSAVAPPSYHSEDSRLSNP